MGRKERQPWETEREITPGGSEVIRHEAKGDWLARAKRGATSGLTGGTTKYLTEAQMDLYTAHVEKHVGSVDSVLHEIVSDGLHIDVLYVKPTEDVPFVFLSTMGMSARAMKVPRGDDSPERCELCIFLPAKWPIGPEVLKKHGEDAYWPVRWLKTLARLPLDFDTYLALGHTIPNGDPAQPLSKRCRFTGFLVAPVPIDGMELCMFGREMVGVYALAPLYEEEMRYKLDHGVEELLDLFEKLEVGVADLADPKRPNVALGR